MKTSKPFSTISYNSIPFLTTKLDEFLNQGIIYYYQFIYHYKEEDEAKDHIHLYVVPNGQRDTDFILNQLVEFDALNPLMPLRCLMPRKSNTYADWYLYSLHDARYLALKGQTRQYHYAIEDFIVSNADEFKELRDSIDYNKLFKNARFFEALERGVSLPDMVASGIIPAQQYQAYKSIAFDSFDSSLKRAGTTHTPKHGVSGFNPDGQPLSEISNEELAQLALECSSLDE